MSEKSGEGLLPDVPRLLAELILSTAENFRVIGRDIFAGCTAPRLRCLEMARQGFSGNVSDEVNEQSSLIPSGPLDIMQLATFHVGL